MSFDIPTVAEIQLAAESGQRITQDDVSAISQAESALTGHGPARGGPAGKHWRCILESHLTVPSHSTEPFHATDEF